MKDELDSIRVLSEPETIRAVGLTAFVGANMLQSAFTGFCPLVKLLKALGVRPGRGVQLDRRRSAMSAFGGKTDIGRRWANVCF